MNQAKQGTEGNESMTSLRPEKLNESLMVGALKPDEDSLGSDNESSTDEEELPAQTGENRDNVKTAADGSYSGWGIRSR